jgi:hypothetical protein
MCTVLDKDMLTIVEKPVFVVPGHYHGKGSEFEGHEFFEASSIRKRGDTYYFVYSSALMTELCYATSKSPTKDFHYGGVIVSNCDLNIDTYKPAEKRMYPSGNNHGSIVEIAGQWYIFYHRQTNGTWYSRQGCIEPIRIEADGSIKQVEMTSQGANGQPLAGRGEYPAYIACHLFNDGSDDSSVRHTDIHASYGPRITQDGRDGDEEDSSYIVGITDATVIGFKYFDCQNVKKVKIKTRAYCRGAFAVKLAWDGEPLGHIPVVSANLWTEFAADIAIPDGVHALYFEYKGTGNVSLASFTLE